MESMRVLHGSVYQRLQIAKDILVGGSPNSLNPQERAELKARTEGLLAGISDANQAALREVLQRLPSGEIAAVQVMTLSLSYDSAAIGNAGATTFLSTLRSQLEDPLVLLAG